jgi:hypothetical protein
MPRRRLVFAVLLVGATGCSSLRDQAVHACRNCGDPVTRMGADGRWEVVPRMRLVTWTPTATPAAVGGDAPSPR